VGRVSLYLGLGQAEIARVFEHSGRIRLSVAVAAAFLATRLERDEQARELLATIPDDSLRHIPDPPNVVLAYARLGDFQGAARVAKEFEAMADSKSPQVRAGLEGARTRIARAEATLARAAQVPEPGRSMARAQAYVELGAYWRALRELGLAYAANPRAVAPLYVQLLVALRLEQRALGEAARFLGPDRARSVVEELRAELPPSLRSLPPVVTAVGAPGGQPP
jgi:hypothetical protein